METDLNAIKSNKDMSLQPMVQSSGIQEGQISGSFYLPSFLFSKRRATQPGHRRFHSGVMRSLNVLKHDTRATNLQFRCCQSAAPFLTGTVILDLCAITGHSMDHLSWPELHGGVRCLVMAWCSYHENSAVISSTYTPPAVLFWGKRLVWRCFSRRCFVHVGKITLALLLWKMQMRP